MKTAAKVFIWLGMILGFPLIFPIIVGVMALGKIDSDTPRSELKNFGIITLFFCSFLGGLFMILLESDKKSDAGSTVTEYKKVVMSVEEQRALNGGAIAERTRVLMFVVTALSVVCCVFDSVLLAVRGGAFVGYYVFLPSVLQFIFLAISVTLYFYNKLWVNKVCYALLICSVPILAWLVFWSIIEACGNASVVVVLIILISICLLATVIALLIINRRIFFKTKIKVTTSVLEKKLAEITQMLENNIITQEEYNDMRKSIISNYK